MICWSRKGEKKHAMPGRHTPVIRFYRGARTMTLDGKTHRIYLATADFGPAAAQTATQLHPRSKILPGTFKLLVVSR